MIVLTIDILETEDDEKAFKFFATSTMSVEIQKDETLHKIYFGVGDKVNFVNMYFCYI